MRMSPPTCVLFDKATCQMFRACKVIKYLEYSSPVLAFIWHCVSVDKAFMRDVGRGVAETCLTNVKMRLFQHPFCLVKTCGADCKRVALGYGFAGCKSPFLASKELPKCVTTCI